MSNSESVPFLPHVPYWRPVTEGVPLEPLQPIQNTLGGLIHNLKMVEEEIEDHKQLVRDADASNRRFYEVSLDAYVFDRNREFDAIVDLGRIRTLISVHFGRDLSQNSLLELQGKLLRESHGAVTLDQAHNMLLSEVADRLEALDAENVTAPETGNNSDTKHLDENQRPPNWRQKKQSDLLRDQQIFDDWKRAKASNVQKKDFARDKKLSLVELDQILNRHAKYTRRNQART